MRIGFDLDGTILKCKEKHCALMEAVTKAYCIQFCKDKYWKDKRSGLNNIESLKSQGTSCSLAKKVNKTWVANIENIEWSNFDVLIPDLFDIIGNFRELGHSIHLISARNNVANAQLQLCATGIDHIFDTINFVTLKSGLEKSDYFNMLNIDCYIGDTEVDFREARKSNICFYPVVTGMRSKDFFNNLGLTSALDITLIQFLERTSNFSTQA